MLPMITVISLGAGVQSTTMTLMAAHGELTPMPDCAIFADTGAEPGTVYEHLRWLISSNVLPFPVHIISAGNLRDELMGTIPARKGNYGRPPFFVEGKDGQHGILQRQCTRHYKVDPLRRVQREMAGIKPRARTKTIAVEVWIGISLDEATRMKPSRDRWSRNRWPLIERRMSRFDCLNWLKRNGYPTPPKSACTFCPYRSDAGWRALRDSDPAAFADAITVDNHVRFNMPRVDKGKVFVHRSLKPLDQVDLSTAEEWGQLDLFNDECEGMCGV